MRDRNVEQDVRRGYKRYVVYIHELVDESALQLRGLLELQQVQRISPPEYLNSSTDGGREEHGGEE